MRKERQRDSFILHWEEMKKIKKLNQEQRGALLTAIVDFVFGEDAGLEPIELDSVTNLLFEFVCERIQRDKEYYDQVSEARSKAGKKGMESRWNKRNRDNRAITDDNKNNNVIRAITSDNKHNYPDPDPDPVPDKKERESEKESDADASAPLPLREEKNVHTGRCVEIQELYNTICKSYSRLTVLSDARKKSIRARFNSGYTVEDFKRLFELAESSNFLKGANDRNWCATFDWLIKDTNMAKVLDGNYSDKERTDNKGNKTTNERTQNPRAPTAPNRFKNFDERKNDYESQLWANIRKRAKEEGYTVHDALPPRT